MQWFVEYIYLFIFGLECSMWNGGLGSHPGLSSFIFAAEWYPTVWMCHGWFGRSPVHGCLGCFQGGAVTDGAALNVCGSVRWEIISTFRHSPEVSNRDWQGPLLPIVRFQGAALAVAVFSSHHGGRRSQWRVGECLLKAYPKILCITFSHPRRPKLNPMAAPPASRAGKGVDPGGHRPC